MAGSYHESLRIPNDISDPRNYQCGHGFRPSDCPYLYCSVRHFFAVRDGKCDHGIPSGQKSCACEHYRLEKDAERRRERTELIGEIAKRVLLCGPVHVSPLVLREMFETKEHLVQFVRCNYPGLLCVLPDPKSFGDVEFR